MFTRKHAWLLLAVLSASLFAPLFAHVARSAGTIQADGGRPPAPPINPWVFSISA